MLLRQDKNIHKQHNEDFEMEIDTPSNKGSCKVGKHAQCVEEQFNSV